MAADRTDSELPSEMERARGKIAWAVLVIGVLGLLILMVFSPFRGSDELLNVSYDGTHEFFDEMDTAYS